MAIRAWPGPHPPLGVPFVLNRASPQAAGLAGWWPMRGGDGGVLREVAQNNITTYPGGTSNPTWSPAGLLGEALSLDATNDYLVVDRALLSSSAPFSLCWWEMITQSAGTYVARFALKITGGTKAFTVIRSNDTTNYGVLAWREATGGFVVKGPTSPTFAQSLNIWKHFCITCTTNATSNAAADYALYIDGLPSTVSGTSAPLGGAGSSVNRIGYDGNYNGHSFLMSDIRIYNRALSAAEVFALYAPQTRWQLYGVNAARRGVPASVIFRRTLSQQGARIGSRQVAA